MDVEITWSRQRSANFEMIENLHDCRLWPWWMICLMHLWWCQNANEDANEISDGFFSFSYELSLQLQVRRHWGLARHRSFNSIIFFSLSWIGLFVIIIISVIYGKEVRGGRGRAAKSSERSNDAAANKQPPVIFFQNFIIYSFIHLS